VGAPERILGVDPGSRATGFGVVETRGEAIRPVAHGTIRPPAGAALPERLREIRDRLAEVRDRHGALEMAVETLFLGRNARSAHVLAQVRGVVLLCGAEAGCAVHEYTPMQVKKAVTGYGRAGKEQVRSMITLLLSLSRDPGSHDAADALAAAYCHASHRSARRALGAAGAAAEGRR
jgi:crossover junction endodeoxyribonuclease RuvC